MEAHPQQAPSSVAEKPTGPVAAVLLASGIGSFVLGLFTVLSEASEGIHEFLVFDEGVGPLSGKTTLAVIAFVASGIVLGYGLRKREVNLKSVLTATVVLIALGVLFTFPEVFLAFKSE